LKIREKIKIKKNKRKKGENDRVGEMMRERKKKVRLSSKKIMI